MFDSIWGRPSWEIFAFFAFGTALVATVSARAALRLGADYPRRRPALFGAEVGAIFGVVIFVYLFASTNPAFDEIDGAALSIWEKARVAAFPASEALSRLLGSGCRWVGVAALVAQTAILGALWGALALRRILKWCDRSSPSSETGESNGESK